MNVRIQTYGKITLLQDYMLHRQLTVSKEGSATDALQKGLRDLADVCDVITAEFGEKIAGTKS